MASNFNIQNLHLLNVQVSNYPLFPMSFMSNFISGSRNLPNFKASITTSLPMNKLHSFSPSAAAAPVSVSDSPNDHSFIISYLINSCRLPPELALSRARHVKFNNPGKPDTVLAFFKKHGFTESQVSSIVAKYPRLLICNPENTLLPKLEFLSSLGLSNTEIAGVISAAPFILKRSLEKVVIPCYNLLRNLVESDDESIELVKRYPAVLTLELKVDNVQILQEVGVPPENIVALVKFRHGGYMLTTSSCRKTVEEVKEMGFDPLSMNFLWAIAAMRSMSKSTWENKVQLFKKYGWSDHEFLGAFEKHAKFIMSSMDHMNAVMDFLVNQLGMEASSIAYCPGLISKSLKKRIIPRCSIYQIVLEKGLLKKKRKLGIHTLLSISEKKFLRKVIEAYKDEVPELLTLYQEMLDI